MTAPAGMPARIATRVPARTPIDTPWLVGFALAAQAVQFALANAAIPLHGFKGRAIGIMVLRGIDAEARTRLYVELLLLFPSITAGAAWALGAAGRQVGRRLRPADWQVERAALFRLSAVAAAASLVAAVNNGASARAAAALSFYALGLTGLLAAAKAVIAPCRRAVRLLCRYDVIVSALCAAAAAIFAGWGLRERPFEVTPAIALLHAGLTAALLVAWVTLGLGAGFGKSSRAAGVIARSGIPIALVPLAVVVSNQFQYARSAVSRHGPGWFAGRVSAGLLILAAILAVEALARARRPIARLAARFYFPALLFTAATLVCGAGNDTVVAPTFADTGPMFHVGESILPVQQAFSFGALPFVDVFPTHGLHEYLPQVLYALVNGFRPFESILWSEWLLTSGLSVLAYFGFLRLVDPLTAFLCLLLLPVLDLFGPGHYWGTLHFIAFWPALTLIAALARPGFRRFLWHWAVVGFAVFWRVDLGLAAALASIAVLAGPALIARIRSQPAPGPRLPVWLGPALAAAGAGLLLLSLACALRGRSPAQVLADLVQFLSFQGPVQAREEMGQADLVGALFEYALLPLVGVAYLFHFLAARWRGRHLGRQQLFLVFLAVFSLVASIRSAQRHTLFEGLRVYLFVFLAVCVPLYCRRLAGERFVLWLAGALAGIAVIFPAGADPLTPSSPLFKPRWWKGHEARATLDLRDTANLFAWFDHRLKPGETFFDFTNAPALYVVGNRRFIPYFIPNAFHTAEGVQERVLSRLDALARDGRVPLLVFKQGNGWDALDGVPNEVRSYRVAEYLYRRYRPFARIDGFEVWTDLRRPAPEPEVAPRSHMEFPLHPWTAVVNDAARVAGPTLTLKAGNHDPWVIDFLDLREAVAPPGAVPQFWQLRIRFRSDRAGSFEAFYSVDGGALQRSPVAVDQGSGGELLGRAAIDLQPGQRITALRVDPPNDALFTILGVELAGDQREPALLHPESYVQHFDLDWLPLVWGSYDPLQALAKTPVLASLLLAPAMLTPERERSFTVPRGLDRSTGLYLRVRARAPKAAQVKVSYGAEPASTFSFSVVASEADRDYLVRLTTQYAWQVKDGGALRLSTSAPVSIAALELRKGD